MSTAEPKSYLAFDLGASTSRAFLGTLHGAVLEMNELHRFTTPVLETDGHLYWDLDVIYTTGERERLRTNDLINNGMVCFEGWQCNVGLELLTVDYSGDITRAGGCRVGGIIGSVRHDTRFSFPEKPVVCTQDACLCGTNIMVSKSKE